jgi:hypothetical protein
MALTAAQISELTRGKLTNKGNAWVRNADGKLEKQLVKSSQFGKFEGKAGSKRRSRKGMVRTMPNGWVKYNDVTDIEVVSYLA